MPVIQVAVFVAPLAVNTQILHMGFRSVGKSCQMVNVQSGWKFVFGTVVVQSVSRGIAARRDQRRHRVIPEGLLAGRVRLLAVGHGPALTAATLGRKTALHVRR